MKLNAFAEGKTIKSIRRVTRGHYDYIEYLIRFTDGTGLRFRGTSSANVEVEMKEKRVVAKKKAAVQEQPKSMYDRLKELKYYHPCDESGELFQATCTLCYKFNGFSDPRAETLFQWAKEMAEGSKEWCEQEGMDLDDFITGDQCCH